ncbi:hypothetical protein COY27_00525 [Candidatus Woesearchaeota archaeon CG_4_10_14_0_2_um_filter_33_13]|nr:MAG: hypothetical protein COY27_00525 [Candidatus Woesearchaeota archaeon CG_4_10_14_0_2_um_filter_33_13]
MEQNKFNWRYVGNQEEYSNFEWKKLGVGILTGGIGALIMTSKEKKAAIKKDQEEANRKAIENQIIAAQALEEEKRRQAEQVRKVATNVGLEIDAEKVATKKIIIIGSVAVGSLVLITTIAYFALRKK